VVEIESQDGFDRNDTHGREKKEEIEKKEERGVSGPEAL
jgi:hypothetical protein